MVKGKQSKKLPSEIIPARDDMVESSDNESDVDIEDTEEIVVEKKPKVKTAAKRKAEDDEEIEEFALPEEDEAPKLEQILPQVKIAYMPYACFIQINGITMPHCPFCGTKMTNSDRYNYSCPSEDAHKLIKFPIASLEFIFQNKLFKHTIVIMTSEEYTANKNKSYKYVKGTDLECTIPKTKEKYTVLKFPFIMCQGEFMKNPCMTMAIYAQLNTAWKSTYGTVSFRCQHASVNSNGEKCNCPMQLSFSDIHKLADLKGAEYDKWRKVMDAIGTKAYMLLVTSQAKKQKTSNVAADTIKAPIDTSALSKLFEEVE